MLADLHIKVAETEKEEYVYISLFTKPINEKKGHTHIKNVQDT
jgi:hypothetical protein